MKLNKEILLHKEQLTAEGFALPEYDPAVVKKATQAEPVWLQLGAGNIFRAFLAGAAQKLLKDGLTDKGIIVAEGYDYEIVDRLADYDDLTVNVTLRSSGDVDKEILASITEYLKMDPDSPDFVRLQEILRAPSLQLISLTITEKGYSLVDNQGQLTGPVAEDFRNGPKKPISYMGKIAALLFTRFEAGQLPLAVVSMDNMSHNGEKLQKTLLRFADEWVKNGVAPKAFVEYLGVGKQVSFPWTMIDKITPRPDPSVEALLTKAGLSEMGPVETTKHTFVAPYVNGEETEYLVIEDTFPNGRPPLEKAGVIFTDRQTVNQVETMKVTTCLNPLHTALAVFGCLLGYTSIHAEMKDTDLASLIKKLGYDEGLPVVVDPKIIDPKQFIDEVIQVRFPNPYIPDTPQRIATDTSQKLSVRYGETLKAYLRSDTLSVSNLKMIPLVFAGWLRYLTGISDDGTKMALSPDPLLDQLTPLFVDFRLGTPFDAELLRNLLADEQVFGVDLNKIGLSATVLKLFTEMSSSPGAVRTTIQQVLAS